MKIALDAMGGDKAPAAVVQGGIDAARELGVSVVLVGREEDIKPCLDSSNDGKLPISVVSAPQVIAMDEQPTIALRTKSQSSIVKGLMLVKLGEADAFVSAGSTGAVGVGAYSILGCIQGVKRPAIALLYSTLTGRALFLDAGANADCRPQMLLQFAQMGSLYMQRLFGIANPRVGLLNIGEEETKGNRLIRETHRLLKDAGLNFIGNVEGKDVYRGVADVVVTDGFTGNVALKLSEGLSEAIFLSIRRALASSVATSAVSPSLLQGVLTSLIGSWDYSGLGGAYLLGIKGNVIIAHGRSDALAIKNAIGFAKQTVEQGALQALLSGAASKQ